MISGGVDAPLAPGILAGFNLLTVLTTRWNDEPARASRPFSRDRSGIVLGEGAWIYVLEEFEHAKQRGAKIYAEINGYGATCDAHHRVRLEESGDEPARAMRLALADAGLAPEDVDYINLHGTSTLLNDRIETSALKLAFNSHAPGSPCRRQSRRSGIRREPAAPPVSVRLFVRCTRISSPRQSISTNPIPIAISITSPITRAQAEVRIALCNCIGFGSKNSALVVEKTVNRKP